MTGTYQQWRTALIISWSAGAGFAALAAGSWWLLLGLLAVPWLLRIFASIIAEVFAEQFAARLGPVPTGAPQLPPIELSPAARRRARDEQRRRDAAATAQLAREFALPNPTVDDPWWPLTGR